MNIRTATKFDLPYFLHVTRKVRDMNFVPKDTIIDNDHLNVMFNTIIHGGGVAIIAEINDEPIGIIIGIINENLWIPKMYYISQILFYIDEEYRNTRAGYNLLKEYNKRVEELISTNRVQNSLIYASEPLFDIDFTKYGYKVSEKIWQLEI